MKHGKRILAGCLCLIMIINMLWMDTDTQASVQPTVPVGKTITLAQAKALGLTNSSDYTSLKSKLALAEVQYSQSVKRLQLKQKDQATFRWTPLLNFKFPESPTLDEAAEYIYKPLELQANIDVIKHQILDNEYAVYESVTLQYVECYTLQEKLRFYQEQLQTLEDTKAKNEARLLIGQATQTDVDRITTDVEKLQTQVLGDMRSYETAKEKLTDLIGLDVRSGYTFMNPYSSAELKRENLEDILSYACERDQGYYEAQVNTANALLELNTNNRLMRNQYGTDMELINSFVQQVLNGEEVDQAAFRLKYDQFLKVIDQPWQGSFKILFIRIPREWKKGEIDGVRYVEEEPYALYEAALNYQDLYKEEQSVKKDLEDQITDSFNNYIAVKTTYESLTTQVATAKEQLEKDTAKNLMGQFSYEELADEQTDYANLQIEELDALAEYTKVLTSYDRLTCGAVSVYLTSAADSERDVLGGGASYVVEEEEDGIYYYIHSLAANNAFEFGLYVPEDFEADITAYELWVNGTQIGERTDISRSIQHLALTIESVDTAFVRLYSGDKVVDDCTIDPSVYSGRLTVTTGYQIRTDETEVIGTYTLRTGGAAGIATLGMRTEKEEIQYYDIWTADGICLAGQEKLSIQTEFKYLGLIASDLSGLTVRFYDSSKSQLYECQIDTENQRLIEKKTE